MVILNNNRKTNISGKAKKQKSKNKKLKQIIITIIFKEREIEQKNHKYY